MRLLAFVLACLAALPVEAAPTYVEADYRITASGITIASVSETYERQGDTYRIDSKTRAEGVLKLFHDDAIVLHSEGSVGPEGLRPLRFEQRRDADRSRDILARFDWETSRLRSRYQGEETTHALLPGTQDRLSVMYQFMNVLPRGEMVRMPMSNGRKVDRYAYRKVDEPVIETPAGSFATVHYERVTESENEARAQLWLAKDRFNIVVRVVFEDSHGIRLEQSLVRLKTR